MKTRPTINYNLDPTTKKIHANGGEAAKPTRVPRRRVMVLDDHPMTRAGIVQLINQQDDLQVAGEAAGPTEAMTAICRNCPDLLISDMTMPGRAGIEFIKDIIAIQPALRILVLSIHDETLFAERVLRAGARGYIMKEAGGEQLLAAIRRVLNGQISVSEQVSARILDHVTGNGARRSSSPIEKLTDREFEVFQLIGFGKGTRDIAEQLHLSPKTVDVHRARIKEKLELLDSTALVRHAVRWIETETHH